MGVVVDKTEALSEKEFSLLSKKISDAAIKSCFQGDGDGERRAAWSYIFAFAVGKETWLVNEDTILSGQPCGISTASTDGKRFYWNIGFLKSMDPEAAMLICGHEVMHITLDHLNRRKMEDRHPIVWNLATDMAINALISKSMGKKPVEAFAGVIKSMGGGSIFDMKSTIAMFKNTVKKLVKGKGNTGNTSNGEQVGIYADEQALEKGADWAYNELMKHIPKVMVRYASNCSGKGADGSGEDGDDSGSGKEGQGAEGDKPSDYGLPNGFDGHVASKEDPETTKREIMKAAEYAKNQKGCGKLHGSIEDVLGEIEDPTLSVFDLIQSVVRSKAHNNGTKKNYKQYQKRPQYLYKENEAGVIVPSQRLYVPTKKSMYCEYLSILDTSGSMSGDDMVFGLKELKVMNDAMGVLAHGWAIPLDSKVYWDAAVELKNVKEDLAKIRPVGRGGTVFTEFFRDFGQHYDRSSIDLIVCITDGDIYEEPPNPGIDVIWLLTNGMRDMPFGRSFDLRARLR